MAGDKKQTLYRTASDGRTIFIAAHAKEVRRVAAGATEGA